MKSFSDICPPSLPNPCAYGTELASIIHKLDLSNAAIRSAAGWAFEAKVDVVLERVNTALGLLCEIKSQIAKEFPNTK